MGAKVEQIYEEGDCCGEDDYWVNEEEEDEDDDEYKYNNSNQSQDMAERNAYWESQESLLQGILEHHGSTYSKMQEEIARIIKMAKETNECVCLATKSDGCCKCLRQKVVDELCNKGFNSTLSTSKWRHTTKLPGGTHEYIEVSASTQSRKKRVHFLIELNFRDEFKMAKACDEYHKLTNELPEIYIGKSEHLNAIVRVICDAAKRSASEKRIHMGPWRKRNFMLKKWSASQLHNQSFSHDERALISKSSTRQTHMPSVNSCLRFSSASTSVKVV